MLLLDAGEAFLDGAFVSFGLGLLAQVFDGADKKAASAAGGVEDSLAEARVDLFDDELGDCTGRVELAGISGGLEVFEELLVDVAEEVAVIGSVEVNGVDLVDDLPHQRPIFHVVVGVLEGHADEGMHAVAAGQGFELGQEGVIDEIEQGVAGDAFFVLGPG